MANQISAKVSNLTVVLISVCFTHAHDLLTLLHVHKTPTKRREKYYDSDFFVSRRITTLSSHPLKIDGVICSILKSNGR